MTASSWAQVSCRERRAQAFPSNHLSMGSSLPGKASNSSTQGGQASPERAPGTPQAGAQSSPPRGCPQPTGSVSGGLAVPGLPLKVRSFPSLTACRRAPFPAALFSPLPQPRCSHYSFASTHATSPRGSLPSTQWFSLSLALPPQPRTGWRRCRCAQETR